MGTKVFCVALAAAVTAWPAAVPERLARIKLRMQAFVDAGKAAGTVTLVMHKGQVAHHEATGVASIEGKTPMKADTIFQIMSMTKPVTCTGIMMLAEEGKLGLNDPVEKHLPEFRGQMLLEGDRVKKPSRRITIRDLMTHTSGMAEMPPEGMGGVQFYYRMNLTLASAVNIFSQMPLQFEPGSKFQYCNPGIATLGRIIEVVAGQPYESFLDERVFRPLGMKDSFFFPPEDRHARIAAVYQEREGKLVNMGPAIYRKGAKYPMPEGGMYSTAPDMAAFYEAFRKGGKPLLSRAGLETMVAIQNASVQRGGSAYGLGWSVVQGPMGMLTLSAQGAYGHGGAFGTYGWVDPKREMVGVFLIQLLGGAVRDAANAFVEIANSSWE